uniref:Cwf19-like C-terminal domain-containing protein n=1 Tax=Bracon brevicornis TaxID=1563983 RepID=A0A6V7KZM5_9HYME
MNYINFESSRVKERERENIRRAREKILAEAEEKYRRKEAAAERSRQRGDDKWMLPSVEEKLSGEKVKKRKRKSEKKSKKSKKHKRRRETSSSSSSDSSDNETSEWVEKSVDKKIDSTKQSVQLERDEWMNLSGAFTCVPREKKQKIDDAKKETCILDKPGQSSRELNPYWKDGGTGLPGVETNDQSVSKLFNPDWLKKSLQRAKEQALEEGRSLEEIATERWGSLETIESMIQQAERNVRSSRSSREQNTSRYTSLSYDRKNQRHFKKPSDSIESTSNHSSKSTTSVRSWRKPEANQRIKAQQSPPKPKESKNRDSSSEEDEKPQMNVQSSVSILSEDEMNKLGAKIVKAEIMGDLELAAELKSKLEKARAAKASNVVSQQSRKSTEENVILTVTNSKGMSRPLEPRSMYEEPQGGRRRANKTQTHEKGQRVRYFADDDKYSLQDMFQREKGESSHKDDSMFVKLASKSMDMDELFEETITRGESDSKQDLRDKMRAIKEHKNMEKSLESCRWCFDSKEMLKHLIVSMGKKIYISLPSHTSLTSGHCIIAPIHHISCQTQMDEDVYEELKDFKKALTKMYQERKQYPVFFEVAMGLHKFPHMRLECVPIPEDVGFMAPMYFKKALSECEMEWSTNKKIVDLKEKDIQKSIPKGLPYFMVDFGDRGGFAHVIEDEKLFPRNFAQEIIGGMMDLSPDMWRRPRRENFDQQRGKVLQFADQWKSYDITA